MKQETFTRVVKYGALSLVALVISPIIFAVVKGAGMKATLAKLRSCMKKNLPELKDATGTHAKWQDVQANDDGKWPVYELP